MTEIANAYASHDWIGFHPFFVAGLGVKSDSGLPVIRRLVRVSQFSRPGTLGNKFPRHRSDCVPNLAIMVLRHIPGRGRKAYFLFVAVLWLAGRQTLPPMPKAAGGRVAELKLPMKLVDEKAGIQLA